MEQLREELWENVLWRAAKKRALSKKREFTITPEHVRSLGESSGYTCALTGIPFDFSPLDRKREKRRPFAPSLDRIDPNQGYTPENTRLVLVIVNLAMNEFGEDTLRLMAKGLLGLLGSSGEAAARNRSTKSLPGTYWRSYPNLKKPYGARYRGKFLGNYETEREAHNAYIIAKRMDGGRNGINPPAP